MKNTLTDLNNHLFAQMERLSDEDLTKTPELLEAELKRTKGISNIAKNIISNADLVLKAKIKIDDMDLPEKDKPKFLT